MSDPASISLTGRRAVWYARISRIAHAAEPFFLGVSLAFGIWLATHKAGEIVVLDRRGAPSGSLTAHGVWLLAGVTLVAASLIFFHRKPRVLRQRLLAALSALLFFGEGYRRELASEPHADFFGLSTLPPSASFTEDFPARPKVEYRLNSFGLRGPPFPIEKPSGAIRIAVVGDSFVFGSGVEEPDTLPAKLTSRLRDRFPAAMVEVLNLGVPGNNLSSHLAWLDIAERRLGASVLVLCLTLPNDLSSWDGQSERREHARIGGFSLVSYLFGYRTAITLWGERNLARDLNEPALGLLRAEMGRFAASRSPTSAPLVIFAYSFEDPRVTEILRPIPRVSIAPPVAFDEAHFIPGDGHPTALGNETFAKRITAAFEPDWLRPQ